MMLERVFGVDVRVRPVVAGLAWAAVTLPLLLVIERLMGQPVTTTKLAVLIVLFVPAGLFWGYATRWLTLREDARAG